jgi:hypothetical protein
MKLSARCDSLQSAYSPEVYGPWCSPRSSRRSSSARPRSASPALHGERSTNVCGRRVQHAGPCARPVCPCPCPVAAPPASGMVTSLPAGCEAAGDLFRCGNVYTPTLHAGERPSSREGLGSVGPLAHDTEGEGAMRKAEAARQAASDATQCNASSVPVVSGGLSCAHTELDRSVAIKVLRLASVSPPDVDRFLEEPAASPGCGTRYRDRA